MGMLVAGLLHWFVAAMMANEAFFQSTFESTIPSSRPLLTLLVRWLNVG